MRLCPNLETAYKLIFRYEFFFTGKRLCAGETFARQSMFLIVAGLLQHFSFKTPEGAKKPDLENVIWGIIVTIPDYWMEVVSRDD